MALLRVAVRRSVDGRSNRRSSRAGGCSVRPARIPVMAQQRTRKGVPAGGGFSASSHDGSDGALAPVDVVDGVRHYVYEDGAEEWTLSDGRPHRLDGPARIQPGMYEQWWKEGRYHRDGERHRDGDEPAVEAADGGRIWMRHGKTHRDGGPAIVNNDGSSSWWQNGALHRDGGPALTRWDGVTEWYQYGRQIDPMTGEEL